MLVPKQQGASASGAQSDACGTPYAALEHVRASKDAYGLGRLGPPRDHAPRYYRAYASHYAVGRAAQTANWHFPTRTCIGGAQAGRLEELAEGMAGGSGWRNETLREGRISDWRPSVEKGWGWPALTQRRRRGWGSTCAAVRDWLAKKRVYA